MLERCCLPTSSSIPASHGLCRRCSAAIASSRSALHCRRYTSLRRVWQLQRQQHLQEFYAEELQHHQAKPANTATPPGEVVHAHDLGTSYALPLSPLSHPSRFTTPGHGYCTENEWKVLSLQCSRPFWLFQSHSSKVPSSFPNPSTYQDEGSDRHHDDSPSDGTNYLTTWSSHVRIASEESARRHTPRQPTKRGIQNSDWLPSNITQVLLIAKTSRNFRVPSMILWLRVSASQPSLVSRGDE